jgi:hypothetical protein
MSSDLSPRLIYSHHQRNRHPRRSDRCDGQGDFSGHLFVVMHRLTEHEGSGRQYCFIRMITGPSLQIHALSHRRASVSLTVSKTMWNEYSRYVGNTPRSYWIKDWIFPLHRCIPLIRISGWPTNRAPRCSCWLPTQANRCSV